MKGRRLLVYLLIAILWVGSLALVDNIANRDLAQAAENYNSSKSNTATSIYTGTDEKGDLWIGMVYLAEGGNYRIGAYGKNSVTVGFDEFGNISIIEPRRSPELDGIILNTIGQAFSVWTRSAECPETKVTAEKTESGTGRTESGNGGMSPGGGAAGPGP